MFQSLELSAMQCQWLSYELAKEIKPNIQVEYEK